MNYLREDNDKIYLIDANVKTSESGMKTIIMLGEQKDLDDQIDLLNDKKTTRQKNNKRLNIEKRNLKSKRCV